MHFVGRDKGLSITTITKDTAGFLVYNNHNNNNNYKKKKIQEVVLF